MASSPSSAPAVEFRGVMKRYGATPAVREVSFRVERGEFFSLLGPSGCGKTTSLRLLAGFERADAGQILLQGETVNERRPWERDLAMVFQNYALFPHLTVEQNVAFGLEQRRRPDAEIRQRVGEALELVRLAPATYARRSPAELSGGQKQRVALARALVLRPGVLLLDEPLGALDLKLRTAMQGELRALNRQLGITFIHVTHDQEEALAMSDRIAVMDQGVIAQLGTPAEVYERPRTAFVASFIGDANVLRGRVVHQGGGECTLDMHGGTVCLDTTRALVVGAEAQVALRPEWLELRRPGALPARYNGLAATVRSLAYRGETVHVHVVLADGHQVVVALRNSGQLANPVEWSAGDAAIVAWPPGQGCLLEG